MCLWINIVLFLDNTLLSFQVGSVLYKGCQGMSFRVDKIRYHAFLRVLGIGNNYLVLLSLQKFLPLVLFFEFRLQSDR